MADDRRLLATLEAAKQRGYLGPGPVTDHVEHATSLLQTFPDSPGAFVDLGSGGGVPGLVIAIALPDWTGTLIDGSERRTDFLGEAVVMLGIDDRIAVKLGRAEVVGRLPGQRAMSDVVVARSFGPPAVVAECAAPLLRIGGRLIVSDPPSDTDSALRWHEDGLNRLGLRMIAQRRRRPACTTLEQYVVCPDRFPRRVGVPTKRPLF